MLVMKRENRSEGVVCSSTDKKQQAQAHVTSTEHYAAAFSTSLALRE